MRGLPGHPHVRGDYEGGIVRRGHGVRAIPTCVGTTDPARPFAAHLHGPSPRAWGLRFGGGGVYSRIAGHPHVRGDYASIPLVASLGVRAIPTCVGTTLTLSCVPMVPAGHPHVRGDYRRAQLMLPSLFGPSPRAWGLPGSPRPASTPPRAIPTCVGTTLPYPGGKVSVSGHPHVRGDYRGPASSRR